MNDRSKGKKVSKDAFISAEIEIVKSTSLSFSLSFICHRQKIVLLRAPVGVTRLVTCWDRFLLRIRTGEQVTWAHNKSCRDRFLLRIRTGGRVLYLVEIGSFYGFGPADKCYLKSDKAANQLTNEQIKPHQTHKIEIDSGQRLKMLRMPILLLLLLVDISYS